MVGFTLLAAGVAMLILPGPGLWTCLAALGVLAGEFVWARRVLQRVKKLAQEGGLKL